MKPRCSKSGLNTICGYSWELDAALEAGILERTDDMDFSSSAYADLGSLIHNQLQVQLGCVMQSRLDEALEPMYENATALFKDRAALDEAIQNAVNHAISIFPAANDGLAWVAEPADELEDLTGHLDFESQNQLEIVDLKTTARKPDNGRMKPLHLYQLVSYWELRGKKAKTGRILYLDSLKGGWAIMTDPVEFDNPAVQKFAEGMKAKRKELLSGAKQFPVPGDHCKSGFCSFRNSKACYNSIVPVGGQLYVAKGHEKRGEFESPTPSKKVKLW